MFLYVCKQTFRVSKVRISQTVKGVIMQNLCDIVFYMNVNVLQNFHICISVSLVMETCRFSFFSHEQSKRTRNKSLTKAQKLPVLVFKVIKEAKKAAIVLSSDRNFTLWFLVS